MTKNIKRITALALCLVLALGLVACGGEAASSEAASSAASGSEAAAPAFDYSAALEDNGHWAGIKALDYVTLPEDTMHITLSAEAASVSEELINSTIHDILTSMSTEVEQITDREVAMDDQVNIDYVGSVDGVEFSGGSTQGNGTSVTAGSQQYVDDFLTQIIGHKPGETFDVVVTFPEGYSDSTDAEGNAMVLANKEAVFKTTINFIEGDPILPELTDEFVVSNYGPEVAPTFGFTTVEELKAGLRADLLDGQKHEFVNSYLMDNAVVSEVPETMVEHIKQSALADLGMQAASYGMTTADLLAMQGITEEAFLEQMTESATQTAKLYLVLQAIAESEGIEVSEDAAREELGENYDGIVEAYGLGYTNMVMLNTQTMDAVIAGAAA